MNDLITYAKDWTGHYLNGELPPFSIKLFLVFLAIWLVSIFIIVYNGARKGHAIESDEITGPIFAVSIIIGILFFCWPIIVPIFVLSIAIYFLFIGFVKLVYKLGRK